MIFSNLQEDIFNWVQSGSGSANIIARAGTGKTTTLVESVNRTKGRALCAAFNKSIADELSIRVQGNPYATAATLHSVGFSLWRKIKSNSKVDSGKVRGLAKKAAMFDGVYADVLCDAVGYAKGCGFGLPEVGSYLHTDEVGNKLWTDLFDFHDLWDELPSSISPDRVLGDCATIYQQSINLAKDEGQIDFNDMILLPLLFSQGKREGLYDWVMVDEAQDTSDTRRMLALHVMKEGGRFVAVGDPCQPPGTLVYLVKNKASRWSKGDISKVPIESLKVGDLVISYDQHNCAFVYGRRVAGISSRPFTGKLVCVTTLDSALTSKYTPNHHCLVNFSPLRNNYAVYTMRKGGKYRIGVARMNYNVGICGPASRMRSEGADACWILCTYPTRREAIIQESILSANYGVPQVMFTPKNNSILSESAMAIIWSSILPNEDRGVSLLQAFGRDANYPLLSNSKYKESLKRPIITMASNIMDGCSMLPYKGTIHAKASNWEPVIVSHENYSGPVYSLTVEGEHLYCADGIMTHNCQSIYLFAGASLDAMEKIKCVTGATELPLNITYRCPQSVVRLANQWVPDFIAHESAPEGTVRNLQHTKFWLEKLTTKDVILCRNTRPLLGIANRLRDSGIQCVVEGQSGKALIGLATKWGDIEIRDLLMNLEAHRERECAKWEAKGREDKAEWISEKVGILSDIARGLPEDDSVSRLVQKIEFTFGEGQARDMDVLRLCTIHRAKGREWDRVYLIGRNRYMPSKWAKKEHQIQQEDNLAYVAVTRTKEELVEVKVPIPDPKKPSESDWWEWGSGI